MSSESNPREADRLIFAGLLGLAVASVLAMIEKADIIDLAQQIGVYAFAFAIPLLAVGVIVDYARRAGTFVPKWYEFIGLLGSLASIIGFASLLFHFGPWVGSTFTVGSVLSLLMVRRL